MTRAEYRFRVTCLAEDAIHDASGTGTPVVQIAENLVRRSDMIKGRAQCLGLLDACEAPLCLLEEGPLDGATSLDELLSQLTAAALLRDVLSQINT